MPQCVGGVCTPRKKYKSRPIKETETRFMFERVVPRKGEQRASTWRQHKKKWMLYRAKIPRGVCVSVWCPGILIIRRHGVELRDVEHTLRREYTIDTANSKKTQKQKRFLFLRVVFQVSRFSVCLNAQKDPKGSDFL